MHAASSLLVVPQFATATFAAEYLVSSRGWNGSDAGRVLAVVALAGALGRLGAGRWSDRRRQPAAPDASGRGAVGGLHGARWAWRCTRVPGWCSWRWRSRPSSRSRTTGWASPPPPSWPGAPGPVGRSGVQNTAQNLAAFATGPLVGALAGLRGFAVAFGACAVFPLLGAWATPVRDEHRDAPRTA